MIDNCEKNPVSEEYQPELQLQKVTLSRTTVAIV